MRRELAALQDALGPLQLRYQQVGFRRDAIQVAGVWCFAAGLHGLFNTNYWLHWATNAECIHSVFLIYYWNCPDHMLLAVTLAGEGPAGRDLPAAEYNVAIAANVVFIAINKTGACRYCTPCRRRLAWTTSVGCKPRRRTFSSGWR